MSRVYNQQEKTQCGVYLLRCIVNNKIYVGATTKPFFKRFSQHKSLLKYGKHHIKDLQNDYNEFGNYRFEFIIVESFNSINQSELDELEDMYIKKYNAIDQGYNQKHGGIHGRGYKHSTHTKKLIGDKNRLNMLGKHLSDKTRKRMSNSAKGKIKSKQHRSNLSKSLSGKCKSEEHKRKCSLANQGSKQPTSIFNESIIEHIRIDCMNGVSKSEISMKYNIKSSTLSGVLSHRRWRHVIPDGWEAYINK